MTNKQYGHPEFAPLLEEMKKLHSDKNHDYAGGGDPLGNFKRVSAFLAQYPDLNLGDPTVVMLVYAMKQLDAALWMLNTNKIAKVEGITPRLKDLLVYAGLAVCSEKDKQDELICQTQ
jgi:hypothetical protein